MQERTPETTTTASLSTRELSERFPLATAGWDEQMWRAYERTEDFGVSGLEKVENALRTRPEPCTWPAGEGCQCRIPHIVPDTYDMHLELVWSGCVVPALAARGIPRRLLTATLDTFDANGTERTTALAAARALLAGRIPGLFLTGPVGTGKSLLAAAILHARAEQEPQGAWHQPERGTGQRYWEVNPAWKYDPPVAFVNVAKALEARRRALDVDDDGEAARAWNIARNERLVVLDDLGAERRSDWVVEQLFDLVDARYGAMLPTVLTSNFSMKELAERLDIRIVDRLQEMVRVVPLTGKSRRGAQQ